jgi:alcohol dehydrogenase class IV
MTQVLKGEFHYPHTERVIFGLGCFRERFHEALERLGVKQAFLITTPSIARSPLLLRVKETIGEWLVGEFTESCEHTPRSIVLRAARRVEEAKPIGALISFGGSSVIDLTKGVALVLAEGEKLDNYRVHFDPSSGVRVPDLLNPTIMHIALPTTLSGSEFTNVVGVTDESRGQKDLFMDAKLTPRLVFLDPDLTIFTPPLLWAGTGMKVVADCLEELCSPRANPLTDALALGGLKTLYQNLSTTISDPGRKDARLHCQFASFMAIPNIINTGLGIVSSLRHQIGAAFGVPHGVASTIILPHALRWNLPFVVETLSDVASALGIADDKMEKETSALRLVEAVEGLIKSLCLPVRLRDVGVIKEAIPNIAEHAAKDFFVTSNPRPVNSAYDLMEVLSAAW